MFICDYKLPSVSSVQTRVSEKIRRFLAHCCSNSVYQDYGVTKVGASRQYVHTSFTFILNSQGTKLFLCLKIAKYIGLSVHSKIFKVRYMQSTFHAVHMHMQCLVFNDADVSAIFWIENSLLKQDIAVYYLNFYVYIQLQDFVCIVGTCCIG